MIITANDRQVIDRIIAEAIKEDLGTGGDITSSGVFSAGQTAEAVIRSKQEGILAGAYLCAPVFGHVDPSIKVSVLLDDGARLMPGSEICRLSGSAYGICAGERTILNFLQRLSGIATLTARFAASLEGTRARLLDTRKTTPLLRVLEKRAVVAGGGHNHRFGLFDMVLIKDTHIEAAGGVTAALTRVHSRKNASIKVEIEVQTYEQMVEAAEGKPDRIMFDNMPCALITRCVEYIRSRKLPIETEASGNVTEATIAAIARTGVDFISSGAITHSARALDIHLIITR